MRWAGRVFQVLTVCMVLWFFTVPAQAQTESVYVEGASGPRYATPLGLYDHFAKWDLRGVSGRRGMVFGLRSDERVQRLQLDLAYQYSSALIDYLSQLNIILNGEVVASLPLSSKQPAQISKALVDLPLAYLQPYNRLELQLIAHYTLGCEDPLHPDLWLDVDASSRLLFDVAPLTLPDDLGILPAPFFDPRDMRGLDIPFVLGSHQNKRLEAAGVVASWLGSLADFRSARFDVQNNQIPQTGNAIVIATANELIPGLSLPEPAGPMLAMRTNPHDAHGKLLIITGRNDAEVRQAAVSLALSAVTLSGPTLTVSTVQELPRKPYDAPRWIPTDRPVALGELMPLHDYTVVGFNPPSINVPLRLPPDLSDWRKKNVPLDLRYQHTALNGDEGAFLGVAINQDPVKRLLLASDQERARRWVSDDRSSTRWEVLLPLIRLGSRADLQFQFGYPTPEQTECRGSLLDVRRSALDPRSIIDFSGFPHHKAMPDLAAFVTAGYPFTRMADLSETMVILPDGAKAEEVSAFLSLLGLMGAQTGYPVTKVTVVRDAQAQTDSQILKGKDLLLIESGTRSALLSGWAHHLPKVQAGQSRPLAKSDGIGGWVAALADWLARSPLSAFTGRSANASVQGTYMAGFESPVTSGRSVVVVASSDSASLQDAVELFVGDAVQKARVQGDLVQVRDGRIDSLSKTKTYYVGNLGFFGSVLWFLSAYPPLLLILYFLGAMLLVTVLYLNLRHRAQMRLHTGRYRSEQTERE